MCRSKSQGGRRCNGAKCVESRRARQRAYQARRRAARKNTPEAVTSPSVLSSLMPAFRESDLSEKDAEYLKLLKDKADDTTFRRAQAETNYRANRRLAVVDHMVSEGRFDILDRGLSDEDRALIQGMSTEQFTEHLSLLRDHLNVDTLINDYGYSGTIADDPAEKAVQFVGEVVNTWMDKQVETEMAALDNILAEWERERSAGGSVIEAMANQIPKLQKCATNISKARADVLTRALGEAVGTGADVAADISSQKKKIGAHLRDVSRLYPDSWKKSVDEKCNPLRIYASNARAHYSSSTTRSEKGWVPVHVPMVMNKARNTPEEVSLHPYFDYGGEDSEVKVVVGGDPSNPDHVRMNEEAAATLNEALGGISLWVGGRRGSVPASADVRFAVITSQDGTLTLRKENYTNLPGREAVIRVHQDSPSTLAHELAHRMENGNPHIQALEARFLSRRTEGEEAVGYYRDKQEFYSDHFTNTYVGKVYNDGYREVLSMGMEMLLYGKAGAGVGSEISVDKHTKKSGDGRTVADREHLNFVLGLLFSARKSGSHA